MIRKIFAGLLLLGLAGLAQAAPVYIEFPSIPGESSAEGHKNWIEINSTSFSPAFSPTMTRGGQGTLKFSKRQDKTSAKLMQGSVNGTTYPVIRVDVPAQGEPTGYMRIELKDVLISSYQAGGSETAELSYQTIQKVAMPGQARVKAFDGKTGQEVISK